MDQLIFYRLPGKATFIPVDLMEKSSIHAFCQKVDAAFPNGVDVLINNAGMRMFLSRLNDGHRGGCFNGLLKNCILCEAGLSY